MAKVWTVTVMHNKCNPIEGGVLETHLLGTGAFSSGEEAWTACENFIKTTCDQFIRDQWKGNKVEIRRHGKDNTEYVVDGYVTDIVYGLVGCGEFGEMAT